jgi:hypothetical protein
MQNFSASFMPKLDKVGHFPVTNFSRPKKYLFGACFELFGRKFGHLAIVALLKTEVTVLPCRTLPGPPARSLADFFRNPQH